MVVAEPVATTTLVGSDAAAPMEESAADTVPSLGPPAPNREAAERRPQPARRFGTEVRVAGFWHRLLAAGVDVAVIAPVAVLTTWLAGAITGIRPPASVDIWLDLVLSSDPSVYLALQLSVAVAAVYVMVFQIVAGRTLGMRLLGLHIIDVYGDTPSPARALLRTVGYVGAVATLMLGFFWIAIDREKRGLHDWLAGTYVIRA